MKKLVVIVSLMLVSAYGFSQETPNKENTTVKTETTSVKTEKVEVSKDSTKTVAYASTRAIIESNFDQASFLYRGRKSKTNKLC